MTRAQTHRPLALEPGVIQIPALARAICDIPRSAATLLIGIDGCGGSGKSTLGEMLGKAIDDCTVVQIDDFYFPSADRLDDPTRIGGEFDVERVRDQLLAPLAADKPGRYQRYDWDNDELAEWHDVPVGGVVVLEGVYSTMELLRGHLDARIWVETSAEERLRRGIERDGEESRHLWTDLWMPAEDLYVSAEQPDQHADLVIDGAAGLSEHSPYVTVCETVGGE